ncbi:MAG: carboxypeptidase regulatory-like domain-containing protein, partial [Gaiellaceae bacterium]
MALSIRAASGTTVVAIARKASRTGGKTSSLTVPPTYGPSTGLCKRAIGRRPLVSAVRTGRPRTRMPDSNVEVVMRRLLMLALISVLALSAFPATNAVAVATRPAADSADASIAGLVKSATGAPITGAQVFLERMNIGATTNDSGRYRFQVPAARIKGDSMTLAVKIIGFRSQSRRLLLKRGEGRTEDFSLQPQLLVLAQLVSSGQGIAGESAADEEGRFPTDAIPAPAGGASSSVVRARAGGGSVVNAVAAKAPNVLVPSTLNAREIRSAEQLVIVSRDKARGDSKGEGAHASAPLPAVTQGTLRARGPDGEIAGEFPLKHTQV